MELVEQSSGTDEWMSSLDTPRRTGQAIDVAIAPTEDLIAGILNGYNNCRIVGTYVRTCVPWAVITATASPYQSVGDLQQARVGIAKPGDRSDWMARILALQNSWNHEREAVAKHDLRSLCASVCQNDEHACDYFLWDLMEAQAFCDAGQVRTIGALSAPWPALSIAASMHTALNEDDLDDRFDMLQAFLHELDSSIKSFANEETRKDGSMEIYLEMLCREKPAASLTAWMNGVRWAGEPDSDRAQTVLGDPHAMEVTTSSVSRHMLKNAVQLLARIGAIESSPAYDVAAHVDSRVTRIL